MKGGDIKLGGFKASKQRVTVNRGGQGGLGGLVVSLCLAPNILYASVTELSGTGYI